MKHLILAAAAVLLVACPATAASLYDGPREGGYYVEFGGTYRDDGQAAVPIGLRLARDYFGRGPCASVEVRAITATPNGVPTASEPVGVGPFGSCVIGVNRLLFRERIASERCSIVVHEYGHAVLGLAHSNGPTPGDPLGMMRPHPPTFPACLAATGERRGTASQRIIGRQERANAKCRVRPVQCRRLRPRLAEIVLGH